MIRRKLGWLIGLAFLVTAPAAAAAPSFTHPVDGQTVTLDPSMNFPFQWTMPQGETWPAVYVGDQPGFYQQAIASTDSWCGGDQAVTYSCETPAGGSVLAAGSHYAVLASDSANDQDFGPDLVSPEIHFNVPYRIGLGCFPHVGCEWPRVSNLWLPFGDADYPSAYTRFNLWAWTNAQNLTMAYKIARGGRVLKRGQHTLAVGGDPLTADQYPLHMELLIYALRGIPKGTPLRLTVTLKSGTASLTRTYRVHASGGSAHGVTGTYETT